MHFPLAFIYLLRGIGHLKGSFGISHQIFCEYEDAFLIWPNVPTNVKNKAVYKGDTLVVAWSQERGFTEGPSYEGRLKQKGENAFWIIKADRSDSGTYKLIYNSPATDISAESINLQVIVSPTNCCIPIITRPKDTLRAELPQEDCGIPVLTPKWMNGTENFVSGNISVLKFESGLVPGVYTACATGESMRCFLGDAHMLCSHYTVSALPSQNESNSMLVLPIIPGIIIIIIIIIALCLVYRKWESVKRTLCCTDTGVRDEENPLMKLSSADVGDIKRHLIAQYKTMKCVALSACSEENSVDVDHVYCELDIMLLGTEDEGSEIVTSENKIFSSMDAENVRPIPAMILGECGSGKTTWCKNLVHQWCQYHDNKETTLDMNDSSIPDIGRFEILLYIPLKKRLEDSSFMEHVRHTLFANATNYYEYTISYISEHMESVLLLIDGLDEVTCNLEPIVNLLKEEETFPCSIVLTSRPDGLECLKEKYVGSLRLFMIHGMSLESSREYARKVLDMISPTDGEKLNVDEFWKFANHMQVLSMCHIPFLCLSLIFIWSKAISADLTDVLLMIVEYYLQRAIMREWYNANVGKVNKQQHSDISSFIAKKKNTQYLRNHRYLLEVISCVAKNLWCVQMDADIDRKSIEKDTETMDSGKDVKFCLQTGILSKTFMGKLERTRSQIIFSHPLLFDLFVALSIAMEKGESFRRCITTKKAVVQNSCMIHMLCQVAPNVGKELIVDISKIFDKDNENEGNVKTEESAPKLICDITLLDWKVHHAVPVKWLKTLMYMNELSNAKLLILTAGLKFTKDLKVLLLQLSENKHELVFRLPVSILSKLDELTVDIENCTLVLDEEQEWSKRSCSKLHRLVIKSVNIDVKTLEYIIEVVSKCKHLQTLKLCPKDDSNAQILALSSNSWKRLAEGIKDMTELNTVQLHNLQIREYLPALLESLCKCKTIEMLDLMNLNEIDKKEILKVNAKDQDLYGCKHQEAKHSETSNIMKMNGNENCRTLWLIKNAMSKKSWSVLSAQLECLSPHVVHVEQVHQSLAVVHEVFRGIGRCKDLKVLAVCSPIAGNHAVSFYGCKELHKLKKFSLSKIMMPDSSWIELSKILAKFAALEVLSLAHLEIKNHFIEVNKLSKVKRLKMWEVHLEDGLWSKLGDQVMTLSNLERLKLVSCKMSNQAALIFSNKMNRLVFHVEMEKNSKVADSEMVSIDMTVTLKIK